jgi:acyl-coenzyme A synthetase/AMP-(fatty) acid ligase
VVVVCDGYRPGRELARELQEHVKAQTAPYKYPRLVDFVGELPKTASGKVRRALLRDHPPRWWSPRGAGTWPGPTPGAPDPGRGG